MGDKDIISKQTFRHLAYDLATYLLGLKIEADSLELLETEHQRIEDRRADMVVRVREIGGEPFILHVEIQNTNDRSMPWRMLRYLTDIRLRHPDLAVRQHLIYIGADRLRMQDGIGEAKLEYRYGLLDVQDVDCDTLIRQDNPDALVLAILCNFRDHEPQAVINRIVFRLRELTGEDARSFREYIDMLEILSENRDLKENIKEAEKMLTQVDVEKLPSYELGMERGLERGLERGKLAERATVRRLARGLLGLLPDEVIAEKTGLSLSELSALRDEQGDASE